MLKKMDEIVFHDISTRLSRFVGDCFCGFLLPTKIFIEIAKKIIDDLYLPY